MNKVLLIFFALLLAISLGVVGCDGTRYNLTMAVSPPGAGTTTPSGTTAQAANAAVNIKAVATPPYQFVKWTAPAGTFTNANAAQTKFTMPAQDVTVTAHFMAPLDHFTGYWVDQNTAPYIGEEGVYLEDQFCAVNATVEYALGFGNPAEKWHDQVLTPISNPDHHFTGYSLTYEGEPQTWQVEVKNQFGTQNLTVSGPLGLLVPTQKEGHQPPVGLDHYLVYEVIQGSSVNVTVGLNDQFGDDPEVWVYEPIAFANPVRKTHDGEVTEIVNPEAHLVIYWIEGEYFETQIQVVNQFGQQTLDLSGPAGLIVPSEKVNFVEVEPLDHFKCYWADLMEPQAEPVYLEDQFGAFSATVEHAEFFCNPVEKWHDQVLTPISNPDNHLTIYPLLNVEPQTWQVEVNNQFGTQLLTVSGPSWLAVPTQKVEPGDHEPPVGLDHFLLYDVTAGPSINVVVDLNDEFVYDPDVLVHYPVFFANPVRKTHDGVVTEIVNPEAHLVFYWIWGKDFETEVQVVNQFGEQTFNAYSHLYDYPAILAVPSEKTWEKPLSFMVSAGGYHTVGLRSDGTVVAVGYNTYGQCNVGGWTGINQVAAGLFHTVGVKADGTVVAVGDNSYGQLNVGGWTNIIRVAAGWSHTVGLKSDGTVVAVGDNFYGQCDVGGWTNIIQVAAGTAHTVGLKSDGTVVAVGDNTSGQCNVGGWTNIIQVSASGVNTVGLKADGTVVALGDNFYGQCDVGGWTNIIQVAAGGAHTVGLKSDGTVVAVGSNAYGQCNVGGWTDIVQIAAGGAYAAEGDGHTVGLKSNGTVVAVGYNYFGQCNVGGWDLN